MANCTGDSYVQVIDRTECVGNSLVKINENFKSLDTAVCELQNFEQDISTIEGVLVGDGAGNYFSATPGVDFYKPGEDFIGNLVVYGSILAKGVITSESDVIAYAISDERLKQEITPITNALEKVLSIRGVEYSWNEELQETFKGKDVGVIAQEVEANLPEAVATRSNGYKAVRYEKLIPLLIESIRDLKQEIEELKKNKE